MQETTKERIEGRLQQAEGAWNRLKGRIREAWGALTDDVLDRTRGRKEQLIGAIQQRTGEARADVARKLQEIADEIGFDLEKKDDDEG